MLHLKMDCDRYITRAKIRAFAYAIACDIHPLNNLRVLNYLKGTLECTEQEKKTWYAHWLTEGFHALEKMCLSPDIQYTFGDTPTLADICLIPQIYNAKRLEFSLTPYPKLEHIYHHCLTHPAFEKALPEKSA